MISHDDRILHHALGKLLSEGEATDLAPAVVEAWERGELGSYAPEEEAEDEEPGRARASAPRRLWPRVAVAASLLGAGVAFTALLLNEDQPAALPPLAYASASRPLDVLSEGAPQRASSALEIGDRVRVPSEGQAVEVRLASGGLLRADPGAVFALDERRGEVALQLELGRVRVRRGGGPALVIETGFATLTPDPWAELLLSVEADDAAWIGASAPSATDAVVGGRELPLALLVEVRAGSAELEVRSERRTLRENDALTVRGEPAFAGSVVAADTEWMMDLCRRAAPFEDLGVKQPGTALPGVDLAEDDADAAARELFAYLDENPGRWALLQPALLEYLAEEPDWYVRDVLRVIVTDDSDGALRLARALWRQRPARFAEDHVIALAEHGAFEFVREVRAVVDDYEWGQDFVPVRSAAYLMSLGDERGLSVLEDAARAVPVDQRSMIDLFVAALALDRTGRSDAWIETRAVMAGEGLYALKRGDEGEARFIAGALELVELLRARDEPLPVAFFEDRVARHLAERKEQVSSETGIAEILERWARD